VNKFTRKTNNATGYWFFDYCFPDFRLFLRNERYFNNQDGDLMKKIKYEPEYVLLIPHDAIINEIKIGSETYLSLDKSKLEVNQFNEGWHLLNYLGTENFEENVTIKHYQRREIERESPSEKNSPAMKIFFDIGQTIMLLISDRTIFSRMYCREGGYVFQATPQSFQWGDLSGIKLTQRFHEKTFAEYDAESTLYMLWIETRREWCGCLKIKTMPKPPDGEKIFVRGPFYLDERMAGKIKEFYQINYLIDDEMIKHMAPDELSHFNDALEMVRRAKMRKQNRI